MSLNSSLANGRGNPILSLWGCWDLVSEAQEGLRASLFYRLLECVIFKECVPYFFSMYGCVNGELKGLWGQYWGALDQSDLVHEAARVWAIVSHARVFELIVAVCFSMDWHARKWVLLMELTAYLLLCLHFENKLWLLLRISLLVDSSLINHFDFWFLY